MNSSSTMHCLERQNLVSSVLPPILIIEFLLGLPGNGVALWIFCCRLHLSRPNTVYLLNLVIADFLLLASLPFRIDNLMRREVWVYSEGLCQVNLFMLAVNRSASIAFMTVLAAERYFKVVYPHHRLNHLSRERARVVAAVVWVAVVSLRVPLLTVQPQKSRDGTLLCRSFSSYKKPPPVILLHYLVYILEFFLPFFFLIFCSMRITCVLRQRQMDREPKVRRAIRAVQIIVAIFTVCFLPGIATGLSALLIQKVRPGNCYAFNLTSELFSLSIGFTYLKGTLDPILYCFSSTSFRNALKESLNRLGVVQMQTGSEVSN